MSREARAQTDVVVGEELHLAFAPLHKRAFGIAVGVANALVCFGITAVYLIRAPESPFRLRLLAEYFYAFTPTWRGAFVALTWGFVVGFVAGWFVAFCRNVTMATFLLVMKTRAELAANGSFLDHI